MNAFDESKADIKILAEFRYCHLLAMIPKDALSPTEQGYTGQEDPIKEKRHKLWRDYTTAIWNYEYCDWCEAINIMKYHRDKGIPSKMRVTLNFDFRPDHVVEYLETK